MYDWLLETISLAKKAKTHPVNDALILSFINRPASSDQLQKHNPKGKDIWLISEFPTWCILRSQVTAADNVCMNKRKLLIQKIHKKEKKKTTKNWKQIHPEPYAFWNTIHSSNWAVCRTIRNRSYPKVPITRVETWVSVSEANLASPKSATWMEDSRTNISWHKVTGDLNMKRK